MEKELILREIAARLHSITCRSNHTDVCGWCYENWENMNTGYSKKKYYKDAENLCLMFADAGGKETLEKVKVFHQILNKYEFEHFFS